MIHLVRMPPEVLELKRSGFSISGKAGRLIYRTRNKKTHIYAIREPKGGNQMAKIKYASFITGLSGKSGSNVFYRSSSSAFGYMRNLVTPTYTQTNEDRGKEFHNLGVQYRALSAAAKTDFQAYARKYRLLPVSGNGEMATRANNGMACFVKMMWNIKKEGGESINLASIVLSDITTLYSATSVMAAIDKGYLPSVPEYQEYSADFIE